MRWVLEIVVRKKDGEGDTQIEREPTLLRKGKGVEFEAIVAVAIGALLWL